MGEDGVGGDYGSSSVHNSHGVHVDGTPWANIALVGGEHGPWGATKTGDGESYTVLFINNNIDPATEQIEHDSPVVLLRKEHVTDTGGPGIHRGGAGHRKDTLFLTAGSHYSSPCRLKIPSGVGAIGGGPGPNGGVWIFPPAMGAPHGRAALIGTTADVYAEAVVVGGVADPETKVLDAEKGKYHYFGRVPMWQTPSGSTFRYQTNGGGGWGDPWHRDPRQVLADVRDEYVSIEGAAREYGVVIVGDPHWDPEGLSIDEVTTGRLRGARSFRKGNACA